jgi:hypothetical protein
MALVVRDLSGRALFVVDDDGKGRDDSGKVVAQPAGSDAAGRKLATQAARWLKDGPPAESNADRKVLMDLAIGDVATAATQAEFGIPTGACVADRVSAIKYVKHQAGVWYQENVNDAIALVAASVAADGAPPEVNPGYVSTSFTTSGFALAAKLPKRLLKNADFDLKKRALRRLVNGLRLAREYRISQLLTTSTNFAAANRIAAGSKWNGGVNPSPLTDLFSALAASVLPANTLILPEVVAQYFYSLPGTGAQVTPYVQGGGELPRILFARQKLLSGGTKYLWAPNAGTGAVNVALVRVADDVETDIPTVMTFRWLCEEGSRGRVVDGVLVREFDGADDTSWLVVAHNDADVIISNQVGAVITGAMA